MDGSVGLLIIGSEILNGFITDTNTTYLAQQLKPLNIYLKRVKVIPDDADVILENFKAFTKRFDITITTGGLGPTLDDLTVDTLCSFLNCKPVYYKKAQKRLEKFYHKKKDTLLDYNRILRQVRYPEKATPLDNNVGFAPGIWVEKYRILCLPGFPIEIKSIWPNALTKLKQLTIDNHQTLEIIPIWLQSESHIFASFTFPKEINVGVHALPYGIRLFLEAKQQHKHIIKETKRQLTEKFQHYICEDPLQIFINHCMNNKLKIGGAESCTGGLISSKITHIPGVSSIFNGSIICYNNHIKNTLLNVPNDTLEAYGAVSKEVAIDMCKNALSLLSTDISFSVTGIAGPTGGTQEKNIGLVYIAITHKNHQAIWLGKFHFNFGRDRFREAATSALFMMLYHRYVLDLKDKEWLTLSSSHFII